MASRLPKKLLVQYNTKNDSLFFSKNIRLDENNLKTNKKLYWNQSTSMRLSAEDGGS